ncbi:MAG: hypothetical protein RL154_965 [Pseudomonadota bacterium]
MLIETKTVKFEQPLYLDSGRILEPFELAYETYGVLNEAKSNAILIFHAFSGSQHAAGRYEEDAKPGWWDALIGNKKAIDTTKFFVMCVNTIGSCYGSTGPLSEDPKRAGKEYRLRFPVITVRDMVRAQYMLLKKLGIKKLHAAIGGSMGGMQALSFAVEYPDMANIVVPLAATHAVSPWVIAINKAASAALLADPAFNNGNYDSETIKDIGLAGLSAARMMGFLGYISPQGMAKKFGRRYSNNEGLFELFGRFEVERYLDYNGVNFPKYFDPLSFLYLLKTLNIFDVSYGYDSLSAALARVKSKMWFLTFRGDTLFLPEELRVVYDTMVAIGKKDVHFINIDSDYGHDAFLVEIDKFDSLIADILDE